MTTIQTFYYNDRPVRIVGNWDDPKFIASDIAIILDIERATSVKRILSMPEDFRTLCAIGPARQHEATSFDFAITELGVYALIFLWGGSDSWEFQRWFCHDIMPQIRAQSTKNAAPNFDPLPVALRLNGIGATAIRLGEIASTLKGLLNDLDLLTDLEAKPGYGCWRAIDTISDQLNSIQGSLLVQSGELKAELGITSTTQGDIPL